VDAQPPTTVRPTSIAEVADVIRPLRANRAVMLDLDHFDTSVERERVMDFVSGVACGLDVAIAKVDPSCRQILLRPRSESNPPAPESSEISPDDRVEEHRPQSGHAPACVLCDLRPAAFAFDSPLEMVLRRDGSRMWSPPVTMCDRCHDTVRHWRFAVAWCPQCERWGRRGVISPCGVPYGA
jgi:hypothetical protein